MKSKRQTIWLVSMLSLMVILSAYYLFTEDGPQASTPTDGQQVSTTNNATTQEGMPEGSGTTADDEVILSEVTTDGGESDGAVTDDMAAEEQAAGTEGNDNPDAAATSEGAPAANGGTDQANADKAAEGTANAGDKEQTPTDEDVLNQMEAQGVSSTDTLTAYQFDRTQENMKKTEELMQAINDDNKTLDEAVMAQQELNALEEKEEKIYDIEEKLKQQYANAVVTESDDKYKVVVVSEKMEAKEAVSIMDLVIKELGVSQDKVSVQYVTQ
ncbi:SpoIIIAH-like family protein [Paenibacillus macerans]|uniref:SpoIIIAH-like family protein n=1 Tax=Paenibacillus macerans TaxID=44252 RepID=UPI003D324011